MRMKWITEWGSHVTGPSWQETRRWKSRELHVLPCSHDHLLLQPLREGSEGVSKHSPWSTFFPFTTMIFIFTTSGFRRSPKSLITFQSEDEQRTAWIIFPSNSLEKLSSETQGNFLAVFTHFENEQNLWPSHVFSFPLWSRRDALIWPGSSHFHSHPLSPWLCFPFTKHSSCKQTSISFCFSSGGADPQERGAAVSPNTIALYSKLYLAHGTALVILKLAALPSPGVWLFFWMFESKASPHTMTPVSTTIGHAAHCLGWGNPAASGEALITPHSVPTWSTHLRRRGTCPCFPS